MEQTAQQCCSATDDPPLVLKARAFGCNEIKCMLEWSRNSRENHAAASRSDMPDNNGLNSITRS